jgi:hypothetical protein
MLHYQKLFQRMVEGVLVIKKGREKSLNSNTSFLLI